MSLDRPPLVDVHVHFLHERCGRADWEAANARRLAWGERLGITVHIASILGKYVWGRDRDTWPEVLGRDLSRLEWTAALLELGTGGAAARLLGDAPWLKAARAAIPDEPGAVGSGLPLPDLVGLAEQIRRESGASIGLAVRTIESGEDTQVELALASPLGTRHGSLTAFLGGVEGRRRAGIAAAAFLHSFAREAAGP